MKNIKLIKETVQTATGEETTYWTTIDDVYISGSTSSDRAEAEAIYNKLVLINAPVKIRETVLEINL